MNRVFLVGVFDVFHIGHLELIKKASKYGELTVGVVKDAAVRLHKGSDRPVINEEDRFAIVESLKYVDDVVFVDEFEIPIRFINSMDYIVIGEDQDHIQNQQFIPGRKRMDLKRTAGVSSSDIIKKMK